MCHVPLQIFQELGDVISVGCGVVAGQGQRHDHPVILCIELAGFDTWKVVGAFAVAVYGEMLECDPGNTGDRIGIFGRRLRSSQHAMMVSISFLIVKIGIIESRKVVVIFRPKEREGMCILMPCGIQRRQSAEIAQCALFYCTFELDLPVEITRDKPEVYRKKLQFVSLDCLQQPDRQ